jgi:hypothetical protein
MLFAEASHCAYPGCVDPLVFEDATRGVRSIAVQIAHIRSEKPGGPRYDASFPEDQLNEAGNLLLLCGKHHTPVDQNESVFTTEELLDWKAAQVAQGGGTVVTDADIANLATSLQSALAVLLEALSVSVEVALVGGRSTPRGALAMPIEGLQRIKVVQGEVGRELLVGVEVTNHGGVDTDVAVVGLEVDVGDGLRAPYLFGGQFCEEPTPYRLKGHSGRCSFATDAELVAGVLRPLLERGRIPTQVRPFAVLGDKTRVEGAWVSTVILPIWAAGTTEEDICRQAATLSGDVAE